MIYFYWNCWIGKLAKCESSLSEIKRKIEVGVGIVCKIWQLCGWVLLVFNRPKTEFWREKQSGMRHTCNKNEFTAAFRSSLLGDWIEKWGGDSFYKKHDLLAQGFLLPTLWTSTLFICFWIDLVRVLATTKNTSAVAGYKQGALGCTRV